MLVNVKQISNRGQSFIEALIAIGLISLVLIALLISVTVSLKSTTISQKKSQANKYVTQGMEIIRSIRDRLGWSAFITSCGSPPKYLFYNAGVWDCGTTQEHPATGFTRTVTLTQVDASEYIVSVEVAWNDSGQVYTSSSTSHLTKWNQ